MQQKRRTFSKIFPRFSAIFLALCFLVISAESLASLTITPLRVVFTGRDRTAEIVLINTSGKTNTYRMGWMHNRQKDDGYYEEIETPLNPDYNPEDMILFSPRQVTIPPGGRQRVRMSLRRPAEMPDGEYRAHLRFQKLAPEAAPNPGNKDAPGMDLSITVNLGFSIPVIVRQGTHDAAAHINDIRFIPANQDPKGEAKLELHLNRTGIHSTIGRVKAYWQPPEGKKVRIGQMNNVVLYPEINRRFVRLRLEIPEIRGGQIQIVYEGDGADRGIIFDEVTIPVGY